jgi:hypothetical protein
MTVLSNVHGLKKLVLPSRTFLLRRYASELSRSSYDTEGAFASGRVFAIGILSLKRASLLDQS